MLIAILRALGLPSPQVLAIYALAFVVACGTAFGAGWTVKGWQVDSGQLATAERTIETMDQKAATTTQIGEQSAAAAAQIQTVTRTIIKEVPRYVSRQADAGCRVPDGFVGVHDSAASGVPPVPPAAGQPYDAASGVDLSAVAVTVADNYGTCNAVRQQLLDLQRWVREMGK